MIEHSNGAVPKRRKLNSGRIEAVGETSRIFAPFRVL